MLSVQKEYNYYLLTISISVFFTIVDNVLFLQPQPTVMVNEKAATITLSKALTFFVVV